MPADALPRHARLGNAAIVGLLRVLVGYDFGDLPSCKAIRADALRALNMREMTYGWPTEMIRNVARDGGRVIEVPVDYRRRADGRSKVSGNLRASAGAGWHMLRVASR